MRHSKSGHFQTLEIENRMTDQQDSGGKLDVEDPVELGRRILQENKKRPLEVITLKESTNTDQLKFKLNCIKQHYQTLKNAAIEFQTRLNFYSCLKDDENNWPGKTDEFEKAKKNLSKLKEELDDKKANIEFLADEAEKGYKQYEEKIAELEGLCESIDAKRARFDTLKEKHEEAKEGYEGEVEDFPKAIKQQECRLLEAEKNITAVEASMVGIHSNIASYREVCTNLKQMVAESKAHLEKLEQIQKADVMQTESKKKWCQNAMDILNKLSGVKKHSMSGNTITVEYLDKGEHIDTQLLLAITFRQDNRLGTYVLDKAEINIESLDVSSIIQHAVSTNDMTYLIHQVKSVWLKHLPFRKQIVQLREKYAIDWIPSEGLLRVMVGEGGHIVCTLQLGTNTAQSGVDVTLAKVEGSQDGRDVLELKPEEANPSLEQWVQYLEETFGKP